MEPQTKVHVMSAADVQVAAEQMRRVAQLCGLALPESMGLSLVVADLGGRLVGEGGGELSFWAEPGEAGEMLCVRAQPLAGLSPGELLEPELVSLAEIALGLDMELAETGLCLRLPVTGSRPLAASAEGAQSAQRRTLVETLVLLEQLRWQDEQLARVADELEDTNRGVLALVRELDERAEHLRSLHVLQSRLLSYLTHEFRTPLSSIASLSQMLLNHYDGDLTEEQQRQVEYILRSVTDLSGLVDDLLILGKAESGSVPLNIAACDVRSLFGALRGVMRPIAREPAVALVFEEPLGVPEMATDESKLTQILRNLITNGLKFTERGEVRITARLSGDGEWVVFRVSDTGIGIAEEDLDAIFEDYIQVQGPIQRRVKGTGLGLPLARRLSRLLGGSLTVESSPGQGSVFTLQVPVITRPDQES